MRPGTGPAAEADESGLDPFEMAEAARRAARAPGGPGGLPTPVLLLDYGIRLLVIALAAWWGSRWLSAPMRRLVQASQALGPALAGGGALPALDERRGTLEVRETARVFNQMARQLAEQFRSRGLLVAAISHDLRTPLTRLRLRLEALPAGEPRQRCVADVHEMNALVDSALVLFRPSGSGGTGEAAQPVDLAALLQALADDLGEQGQDVRLDEAPQARGPAVARVQPAALRRVLDNLVGNALRYGQRARVRLEPGATLLRITIDDDGPGIPAEQLARVFEPFYRVEGSRNRETGGTGLGLYIARELVQRQQGTLVLSNRTEGGLRVELCLPRA
jgi:signal transduction histidine kinase